MSDSPVPTLEAIAQTAGVSRMTVSRVLRNVRHINPATRERVLQAVQQTGYRPNPMVSAFMSYVRRGGAGKGTDVMAYLTSGVSRHKWREEVNYLRFHEGAVARAQQRGYRLEEFWLGDRSMSVRRLSDILYKRGIHGVVTAPMTSSHAHLRLEWPRFSASAIGFSLLKPFLHRATNDQYNSMLIALRELRRLGYRRVGLAMPRVDDERVHYHWSAAYLSFYQRWNGRKAPALYLPTVWDARGFLAWNRQHRPDVIVSTRPTPLEWLQEVGYLVPEDIGYANLDWAPTLASCAGIDQRPQTVGAAAVDLVVEQINHNEFGLSSHPRVVTLSGEWVPGPTVRTPLAS